MYQELSSKTNFRIRDGHKTLRELPGFQEFCVRDQGKRLIYTYTVFPLIMSHMFIAHCVYSFIFHWTFGLFPPFGNCD